MTLAEAPEATPTDFTMCRHLGGFPYGLEPLTLPKPGTPKVGEDTPADASCMPDLLSACRYLLTTWQDPDALPSIETAEFSRELYWFRWITGHQVSFIIWRLMSQADHQLQSGQHDRTEALGMLAHCVRGYCAMLLYTGSCTPEIYNSWIRPSMYLQHRGFSGSWAPDHAPVRHIFGIRRSLSTAMPQTIDLRRAVGLYRSIHAGVAAKLVPNGRSLLQQSGQRHHTHDSQLLGLLYDNYFMTLRAPISYEAVVSQMLRRLAAIGQDVAANGLYPSASDAEESVPVQLRSDEVRALEQGFYSVCFRVAGMAAGLSTSCVTAELASAQQRQLGS